MHLRVYGLAAIWLALVAITFVLHGKRGWWLLVGAPIALLIPFVWTNFYLGCVLRLLGKFECP